MLDIKIERTTTPKEKPADETKLGFGHIFTDHMFVMNYDAGQGWHDARIVPYGDLHSPLLLCACTTVRRYLKALRLIVLLTALFSFSDRRRTSRE